MSFFSIFTQNYILYGIYSLCVQMIQVLFCFILKINLNPVGLSLGNVHVIEKILIRVFAQKISSKQRNLRQTINVGFNRNYLKYRDELLQVNYFYLLHYIGYGCSDNSLQPN